MFYFSRYSRELWSCRETINHDSVLCVTEWLCWQNTHTHTLSKTLWLLLSQAYYFSKINQPPIAYNLSNESSHDKLKNLSYPDRTHTYTSHTTTTHFSGWTQMAHIYNHDKETPAIKYRLQTGTLAQRKTSCSRETRVPGKDLHYAPFIIYHG